MKRKKIFVLLLGITLTVSMLSGCQSKDREETSEIENKAEIEELTMPEVIWEENQREGDLVAEVVDKEIELSDDNVKITKVVLCQDLVQIKMRHFS